MIKYGIALIMGAVTVWCLFPRTIEKKVPIEIEKIVKIEVDNATKKIRDKGGIEHAIVDDKINLVKSISVIDTASRAQLKSVTEQLGIKEKQLKEYLSYTASLEGRLKHATRVNDSTYSRDDGNMKIEFIHRDSDSYFNYNYNANVNYAVYEKGGLFSKKKVVDLWIDDPKVTINGVKKLTIDSGTKTNGFKVDAHGFVVRSDIYLGGQSELKIGRHSLQGGYYYDVNRGVWLPVFGYKFNIVKL